MAMDPAGRGLTCPCSLRRRRTDADRDAVLPPIDRWDGWRLVAFWGVYLGAVVYALWRWF